MRAQTRRIAEGRQRCWRHALVLPGQNRAQPGTVSGPIRTRRRQHVCEFGKDLFPLAVRQQSEHGVSIRLREGCQLFEQGT